MRPIIQIEGLSKQYQIGSQQAAYMTLRESMMQMLRSEYDFMLFDSAPLLAVADASLLELQTDATLLVIRQGCTSTGQMAKAVALLNEERLLGVALNRVVI